MNEKTLKTLEYDKVLKALENKAQSELGKSIVRSLKPISNLSDIDKLQEETQEAYKILVKRSNPPLYGIYNLDVEMRHLDIGGNLEPKSLLKISDSLRVSRALKSFIKNDEGDRDSRYPIIENLIYNLKNLRSLEDEINRCIISEDEISDNASKKLKKIRVEKSAKNKSIRDKLNAIINSDRYSSYLQDNLVTVREGRYVVPIKQENKNNFPGVVHDMSSSGATVFIEPISVVNLNNELRQLEIDERDEIQKILEDLSDSVRDESSSIIMNQKILAKLDFIFAKGKLALDMNGTRPILNSNKYINLKSARHPLLEKSEVVPIDVYLGEDFNSLIITGPNTGGKTVTLKTVGLLTLMSQSGLHIPADFNSELGVFNQVFADIGDEQSIEQSLSTFSSHMTNIVKILDEVDEDSLVLFDELGAGTDPTEGAALAMSILDYLLTKKVRTLATTHYSQLKLYALTREGVTNASVEFDVETLSPTYRLLIGVPGKSNAFEISKRLGLQNYIIDSAKELISQENIEFEDVLHSLEKDRIKAEESRMQAESENKRVKELREKLAREEEKTKKLREDILKQAKEEARDILRQAKEETDSIVADIRDMSIAIGKERNKKIQETQGKLKTSLGEVEADLASDLLNAKSKSVPKNLKVGESVRVLAFDQVGEVLEGPDDKGDIIVQLGIMRVTANIEGVERARSVEDKEREVKTKHIIKSKSRNIKNEIDLRGKSLGEALMDVDKYIDDAYLAGLKEIQIIHGKGTGILRDGISSYLKNHNNVKAHRLGEYSEGGDGVTIVSLK